MRTCLLQVGIIDSTQPPRDYITGCWVEESPARCTCLARRSTYASLSVAIRSYVASYTKNISTLYNKWMSLLLYMCKKQENEYILASYRYTILKNTVITDVAFWQQDACSRMLHWLHCNHKTVPTGPFSSSYKHILLRPCFCMFECLTFAILRMWVWPIAFACVTRIFLFVAYNTTASQPVLNWNKAASLCMATRRQLKRVGQGGGW